MPSSRLRAPTLAALSLAALGAVLSWVGAADAQQQAQGFAVERFYPSAPGGGWFVMDDLSTRGPLGGVVSVSARYARLPLRVQSSDGAQRLNVVSDEAFVDFGFAATYERWRLYLNFDTPLDVEGRSGTVGAYSFFAPSVRISSHPDVLANLRVGVDTRFFGQAHGVFRLGAGAQLFVPSANEQRGDYLTDNTFRAMGRVLFAGDWRSFTYAGHVGVHARPLDDSPTPGSPQGSELLFGVAAGARLAVSRWASPVLVLGPEFYGATAFRSFFDTNGTAFESLFTARLEGAADDGPEVRVRLGAGAGLNPRFGAPVWRVVFGVELFDHTRERAHDRAGR
jgi:hypothetical protein